MTLDQAANIIDISKKTLDDYLSQIRLFIFMTRKGKKYGFDFNKNKDYNVGKLRDYVKLKKKEDL